MPVLFTTAACCLTSQADLAYSGAKPPHNVDQPACPHANNVCRYLVCTVWDRRYVCVCESETDGERDGWGDRGRVRNNDVSCVYRESEKGN